MTDFDSRIDKAGKDILAVVYRTIDAKAHRAHVVIADIAQTFRYRMGQKGRYHMKSIRNALKGA